MNSLRYGIIMAGGSGDRFWPLSTPSYPKQFLKICNPSLSLLQQTFNRLHQIIPETQILIATGMHLKHVVQEQLSFLNEENILTEPFKRNTTGCLMWAVAHLIHKHPSQWQKITLTIVPADHYISSTENFCSNLLAAMDFCEKHHSLVTLGIRPTRPETGYGYIEVEKSSDLDHHIHRVSQFREKPTLEKAQTFLQAGHFLWNAGMFIWTMESFIKELQLVHPELVEIIFSIAAQLGNKNEEQVKELFETLPSISIDFALMEKSKHVYVLESKFEWDDVGSWDALERLNTNDENGNTLLGKSLLVDTKGCIVYHKDLKNKVYLLGVKDLIVVAEGDTVLICHKEKAQEVKKFLDLIS